MGLFKKRRAKAAQQPISMPGVQQVQRPNADLRGWFIGQGIQNQRAAAERANQHFMNNHRRAVQQMHHHHR